MTSLGLPFQGEIRYYVESSYGVGSIPTHVGLPISVKVLDAKLSLADKHKGLRGIDAPEISYLLEQCEDFSFHLEYIVQCGDTLFEDAVIRSAVDCTLASIGFYLQTNACLGSSQTIYNIKGCVNKSCKVSSSINNEYIYSMDFDVKSVVTSSSATGATPAALTGDICAFNVAGSIEKDGNDLAYITNSIDITIDNGTKNYFDHDSLVKQYAIAGELNISGSCDISLNEGGGLHLAEVLAQADFELVVALGGAGCPEITLHNCKFKSSEIDVNISGDIMKENAPFTGKTISYTTV
jgi:hypothetical protein